ncbi:MAG: HAMP domain-containing sensor histidine kinase [Chloroflexi bacterium]|nr:HAMP domain-containing sensor histidine kinase [Chloroflexota bacterium]
MGSDNTGHTTTGIGHQDLPSEESLGSASPVRQYALASIFIVLGALIAVNFVSSRVERESVISRLEHEALEPAKVSTFRIVEAISQISAPDADMLLNLPEDPSVIDRIVLSALVGQQVARVDILGTAGKIVYSTDPFYVGDNSDFRTGPTYATSEYVGAAAISGLDRQASLIEAVISRVPVYTEGSIHGADSLETIVVIYRDVSAAIDAATGAGARFRLGMTMGVMAIVFASLMIVVMRGHHAQAEARKKLRELLDHEHVLVSELDQRNADLKTADEARLMLLSVVTHELGNPLASISAFISILAKNRDENFSDRQIRMVAAIGRGEAQMRMLLSDLLDLSRVEADEMELNIASVDLNDVVNSVVESMTPVVEEKSQTISTVFSNGVAGIDGDRARLDQVIANLISNSSKYSPAETEIKISVSVDSSLCVVELTDQGIGISKEDQKKLFTPFFRADNAETRQVRGSGLGLVICKQIVELHGGKLTLRSARGSGTTFRIEIPIPESDDQPIIAA